MLIPDTITSKSGGTGNAVLRHQLRRGRFENEPHSAVTALRQFVRGRFRIIFSMCAFGSSGAGDNPLRRGRSFLILVSALLVASLEVSAALAQGRPNSPGQRGAPEAQPSGHQTEAVDVNEGKSPAELFQAGCAVCHQSVAGLAKGRGAGELIGFLRQHYTSGARHAAALAGYLAASAGRGGTAAGANQGRVNPNAPIDRPPAPIGSDRKPAQEAARPQEPREPREPAAKRRPPERPPVAARVAPGAPAAGTPAVATEAAAHSGDAPAAVVPPPAEEKPAAPEIPL